MSEFSVACEVLGGQASRLGIVAPSLDVARGRMLDAGAAASLTPMAGALDEFTGHLTVRLAEYGAAAQALHGHLLAAGEGYAAVEQRVKRAAS